MSRLRVAMIAPPWLALPVKGYGGIELVLEGLINGLNELDVDVVVFGNGERALQGITTHSLYKGEQYKFIQQPLFDVLPVLLSHMDFALNSIQADGNFDIIHDHNCFIGPSILARATQSGDLPPALHTLHGPPFSSAEVSNDTIPSNRPLYENLLPSKRLYFVGISKTLMHTAPELVQKQALKPVYNAISLDTLPYVPNKKDYFITLARFHPEKGQHIAVRGSILHKKRLRMAGTVAGIGNPQKLLLELSNPMSGYRGNRDFKYYSDSILPFILGHPNITYSGNLSGARKIKFIAEAKALLFPIQWEEPFGMAVIEALACGTPVIAMNRGAMPEIIEHGVTGFLANDEEEFYQYMSRIGEIDPAQCRRSVKERFTAEAMAQNYVDRYHEVLKRSDQSAK